MAMSPDGQTVVSAAADETLRLWKCFATDPVKKKAKANPTSSSLVHRGIRWDILEKKLPFVPEYIMEKKIL